MKDKEVPKVIINLEDKDLIVLFRILNTYISNLYFTGDNTGRYKLKESFTLDETYSNQEYTTLKKIMKKLRLVIYGSNM
jgi:hypothetical protein